MSQSSAPELTRPRREGPAATPARQRILFVDDEPMVLRSLAATLRRHFEVVGAGDALSGLEMLAREPFPVVVSDCRMPGIDGPAFLTTVRERYPATVCILLTGAGAEGDDAARSPGLIFRLLSKPCPRDALIGAIEAALEHGRQGAAGQSGVPRDGALSPG